MPPSLADLQRALAERILDREGAVDLESSVCVPPNADLSARVAVYAQGYPARIREALRETFPAIANILGDGSFASLSDRYAAGVPAELRNLNHVGAGLPAFLESDHASDELAFLPALAELEWAVDRCFHAEWLPACDLSVCGEWSLEAWACAKIGFQPGLALISAPWPLRELRETAACERSEIDVDLIDRDDRVLVYRRGFEVVVESIDSVEANAIVGLRRGEPLGGVTARLADAGECSDSVVGYFGRWASMGLVTSCETLPHS
jgi:hypothetical protein